MDIAVRPVDPADAQEWLRLRCALWPEDSTAEHTEEITRFFAVQSQMVVFVAVEPGGGLRGLLEAGLREYAEECNTSPVGYIEGWYVDPEVRGQGIGRALVTVAEAWARGKGCSEMASDAQYDNALSREAHRRLGYEEVATIVCFRKVL